MDQNEELRVTGTSTVEETLENLRNKDERFRILFDSFDILDEIIKRIVELRKEAGLSQRDLARLTNMKQPQIARYETQDESPRLETFVRILEALDCKLTIEKKNSKKTKTTKAKEQPVSVSK